MKGGWLSLTAHEQSRGPHVHNHNSQKASVPFAVTYQMFGKVNAVQWKRKGIAMEWQRPNFKDVELSQSEGPQHRERP